MGGMRAGLSFANIGKRATQDRTWHFKDANAEPVEGDKFVAIVHPDAMYDLQGDTNITNYWQYGGAGDKRDDGIWERSWKPASGEEATVLEGLLAPTLDRSVVTVTKDE
jgi:hypothetical protein